MTVTVICKDEIYTIKDAESWRVDEGVICVDWFARGEDIVGHKVSTMIPLEQVKRVDVIYVD